MSLPSTHHAIGSKGVEPTYVEFFRPQYPTASGLADSEGRLLGEGNAPLEVVRVTDTEWKRSRYPGSRRLHTKPFNLSALKQMRSHWEALIAFIDVMRSEYLVRYRPSGDLTISDLWRFSRFAVTVPNYLVNRSIDPLADGKIPPLVAVAFKSLAGIFIVTADIYLKQGDLHRAMTRAEMIDYADASSLFEGGQGVCAAPPQLMREVVESVVNGPKEVAAGPRHHIEELLGDLDTFFRYAALYTTLEFNKQLLGFDLDEIGARVARGLHGHTSNNRIAAGANAYLEALAQADNLEARLIADPGLLKRLSESLRQEIRAARWWAASDVDELPPSGDDRNTDSSHTRVLRLVSFCEEGAEDAPDRAVLDLLATALVDCIDREQKALALFASIQVEINQLLGRPPPARGLTSSDLQLVIGKNWSARICEWLGIRASYGTSDVLIRHGARRLEFPVAR